ncbi:hypothetical protein D9619_006293 [Psilocybe cf. subviscida]|uniref:FAD/NAD(P)-binding domain-containing protein n=1 Tax=Psilocybe cf. subviscida TaxID=2480587 RepID=A0A8H5B3N3_9AGAR|nr:hypothetical protein D9619_006293 [Psilocybe cf. subviscida]
MANGGTPATALVSDDNNSRSQNPIHHARHLKVICIGAGASGLLLAYKLQRSFENFELVIYERNEAVSGTWYENKYPGCACDIPAHVYTWTFEPNPDWSSVYAGSDEIFQYFERFADKYNLRKYVKLQHLVSKAVWNAKAGNWDVEVIDTKDGTIINDTCDILVNGTGVLNAWKWPDIPGLDKFKGKLLHTARWDRSIDLDGKHVGMIGNGSSAIQVLPAIYDKVSKITSFIRSPTWVTPIQGVTARKYTNEERQRFATDPETLQQHRKELESGLSSLFALFTSGSPTQQAVKAEFTALMKGRLQNERLEKLVVPKWDVGCRRLTPGVGYLEALRAEKTEVVYGPIEAITETGVKVKDHGEQAVDVLICATGFDTSYKPRFPIIGSSGESLSDAWAQECRSYFGFAAPGFPNYFMFIGPNSPIGNGPVLVGVEAQADYILKMMNRWQTENIKSFTPKDAAVDEFIEFKDKFMEPTVWNDNCRSWYKNNSVTGKVTALWPGSTLHYLEALAEPRYEDWDFTYTGNRFAYLGNGFSQAESDRTADWAYYIRNEDDGQYLSRSKLIKILSKSGTVVRSEEAGIRGPI